MAGKKAGCTRTQTPLQLAMGIFLFCRKLLGEVDLIPFKQGQLQLSIFIGWEGLALIRFILNLPNLSLKSLNQVRSIRTGPTDMFNRSHRSSGLNGRTPEAWHLGPGKFAGLNGRTPKAWHLGPNKFGGLVH
jgi:hypothetical protein